MPTTPISGMGTTEAKRSMIPRNDGLYSGISDIAYHSDKESLSSSGARLLLNATPAEYMQQLNEPPNPKAQYDVGHCVHKMVLGEGSALVRVDADDWRTKAAKEARGKAWAEGKVPQLKHQIDTAQRMAGKVFEHPVAAKLLERGSAECSGFWHDPDTHVRLRFRPDWLPDTTGRPLIVDYKTAVSANPRKFAKSAVDWGYHMQAPFYIDGLAAVTGADDAAFLFIVQQKEPPHLVSVCQLEPEDIELGRQQNRRAIELYAACRESGHWPGYDGITTVALPGWARRQITDELELQL
jgi:hypothetical protein